MSRIGKQIIEIPSGVNISVTDSVVKVTGPKGELQHTLANKLSLSIDGTNVQVVPEDPTDNSQNTLWGTNASLVKNMVVGVTEGYSKQLEVNGVGFKVAASGQKLTMHLGFSHQVDFEAPKGIDLKVEKNVITISGIDKQQVGQVAAKIRSFKKPEPYKGKGIKYTDEVIRRKAGKTAAAAE